MTDFTEIDGRGHTFKILARTKDFGRFNDMVIAIVPRYGQNKEPVATIAPFGLYPVVASSVLPPTISAGAGDGLGSEALLQAFMDYGWEQGVRPAEYRKMLTGSVRWHLRAIWRLVWGPPR